MDEKHLEIIEKTSQVFMKYGIKSVTMDEIARQLGISKKTIYKYFADKKDLVRTIMETRTHSDKCKCLVIEQEAENAIDALLLISRLVMEHIKEVHPSVFFDLQKYHNDAWQVMQKHRNNYILQLITENIVRGKSEGLYRDNIDPELIARVYNANLIAIFEGDILEGTSYKHSEVYVEFLRFLIRGLTSDRGIEYLKERIKKEDYV